MEDSEKGTNKAVDLTPQLQTEEVGEENILQMDNANANQQEEAQFKFIPGNNPAIQMLNEGRAYGKALKALRLSNQEKRILNAAPLAKETDKLRIAFKIDYLVRLAEFNSRGRVTKMDIKKRLMNRIPTHLKPEDYETAIENAFMEVIEDLQIDL